MFDKLITVYNNNVCYLYFEELKKYDQLGREFSHIYYKKYNNDKNLYTVKCVEKYILRCIYLGVREEFLCSITREPYSKGSKDIISNWVKNFLKLLGIDTKMFSARSKRSASTNKALKSLSSE